MEADLFGATGNENEGEEENRKDEGYLPDNMDDDEYIKKINRHGKVS